jgi:hypothetical protein
MCTHLWSMKLKGIESLEDVGIEGRLAGFYKADS